MHAAPPVAEDTVDGDDARVIERGGDAGLVEEIAARVFVGAEFFVQGFHGHAAAERTVGGMKDAPLPAGGKGLLRQLVLR